MKSELQILREGQKQEIEVFRRRLTELTDEIEKLESDIADKNEEIEELERSELPSGSLVDQQKLDLLKEHWESITVEDIEAICPISLAYKS